MNPRSFVALAFYFVRQLLARLFGRRRGLRRFEENYGADRLFPLATAERACFAAAARCIACGLCDAELARQAADASPISSDEEPRSVPGPDLVRPSDLALSYTRSLPDLDALAPIVQTLSRFDGDRLQAVCPVAVPFPALLRIIAGRLPKTESAYETTDGAKGDPSDR